MSHVWRGDDRVVGGQVTGASRCCLEKKIFNI